VEWCPRYEALPYPGALCLTLENLSMKKTLIALAALAATAGVAHAQSSVTLYGVADAFVNRTETKTSTPTTSSKISQSKVDGSGLSSSRWGMRGSEDLGGGLAAIFQLEGGFTIDNGAFNNNQGNANATTLFGRQAWVGLKGNFGQVTLGRNYSAYDDLHGQIDHNYDSNTFAVWGAVSSTGIQDYINRTNNSIKYESPSFGGFSGKVGYSFGEDKTATTSASNNVNAQLKYANGPLVVGYAFQKESQKASGATNLFGGAGVNLVPAAPAAPSGFASVPLGASTVNDTRKYHLVGASYDFGVAKILGAYNTAKNSAGTKDKDFQVGVTVPFGAFAVSAGYSRAKSEASLANGGDNDGSGYALLGTYDLSKRTTLYTGYYAVKTEINNGTTEFKKNLFGAGLRHTF
jgi:predicted porin